MQAGRRAAARDRWPGRRSHRGTGDIEAIEPYEGFVSGLAQLAVDATPERQRASRVKPEHVPPGLWFGNEDALVPDVETPWPLTPAQ